jgi:hypothetical protein
LPSRKASKIAFWASLMTEETSCDSKHFSASESARNIWELDGTIAWNSSLGLIEKPPAPLALENDASREILTAHLQVIWRWRNVMTVLLSL